MKLLKDSIFFGLLINDETLLSLKGDPKLAFFLKYFETKVRKVSHVQTKGSNLKIHNHNKNSFHNSVAISSCRKQLFT